MSRSKWFYGSQLLIDTIIVILSYLGGYYIQRPNLFPAQIGQVVVSLIYISIVTIIIFLVIKTYKCGSTLYVQSIFNLIIAIMLIAFSSILIDFIIKGIGVWRKTIFYAICIQVPVFLVWKLITVKLHSRIVKPKTSIIVGKTLEDAIKFQAKLLDTHNHLYTVVHIIQQDSDKLYQCIDSIQQVFISSSCDNDKKANIFEYSAVHNIDCSIVPNFKDIIINRGAFSNVSDLLLFDMPVRMDLEAKILKRAVDIILSLLGMVLFSPIILATIIAIKFYDGGKLIYSQKRLTKGNKVFTIYKFRTMIENAEKETGVVLASYNDVRITKLGKFLRATRIDEIPQLINILLGDMSIVGPRPERPSLVAEIIEEHPEFQYRTLVKAGLTGLAQVKGKYTTEFYDKLLFDLYYVNNYSIMMDFQIIFNTLQVLFTPSVTEGIDKSENE